MDSFFSGIVSPTALLRLYEGSIKALLRLVKEGFFSFFFPGVASPTIEQHLFIQLVVKQ
jgi:hypothetical protein